jgi:hypothetical protein
VLATHDALGGGALAVDQATGLRCYFKNVRLELSLGGFVQFCETRASVDPTGARLSIS